MADKKYPKQPDQTWRHETEKQKVFRKALVRTWSDLVVRLDQRRPMLVERRGLVERHKQLPLDA